MEPTFLTWTLIAFGALTHGILTYVYAVFLKDPRSQAASDLMNGKGRAWRDATHFDMNVGFARTDLMLFLPLFALGSVGIGFAQPWGYVLFGAAGAISLYINIVLVWVDRKHVYEALGPLAYYTYYWGFFVCWGALALAYSLLRVSGVSL